MTEEPDKETQGLEERLDRLSHEVRELRLLLKRLRLQSSVEALLSSKKIIFRSLLSGIFSGLGAVLGATVVLALLLYILGKLQVVPVIGRFVYEIMRIVRQHQHP